MFPVVLLYARAADARTKIAPTNKRGLGILLKICHATKLIGNSSARDYRRSSGLWQATTDFGKTRSQIKLSLTGRRDSRTNLIGRQEHTCTAVPLPRTRFGK